MEKESKIFTMEEKDKKIRAEYADLVKMFDDMDDETKKQGRRLCTEAAFLRIMLSELKEIIIRDGYTERYQNGANQYGYKKSAACDQYDKAVSSYIKIMGAISRLLPKNDDAREDASEIMKFINAGRS